MCLGFGPGLWEGERERQHLSAQLATPGGSVQETNVFENKYSSLPNAAAGNEVQDAEAFLTGYQGRSSEVFTPCLLLHCSGT